MRKTDDFMRRDILEIRKGMNFEKQRYMSLNQTPIENLEQQLEQIVSRELKKGEWEQNLIDSYSNLEDGTDEAKKFKLLMTDIGEIIGHIDNYTRDLWADIYMGVLRIDKENDVKPDNLMKIGWSSKACNSKKINMLSAQKHYPLADYGDDDFPISGIPGGCKKYHELMMKQENIGFFDIDSKRESLKLYAFPKTYEIYQELSYASVENLILLEKTQGIEYTNQLYHYLKKATQKAQIERLLELVRLGTELPMFIRKVIVDKIWSYLYYFQYNDISVQYIRDEIYGIIFITKNIYKEVLQLCWQIFKEGKLPWCALEGTLSLWWRDYYDDREIYQDLMDSKGLHDWRGMRRPEDCLIKTGESLISLDGRGDAILDMVADRRRKGRYQRDLDCGKSEKEIIEDVLKELKKQEKEIWDNVDPREKTRKLKPMDVYAVIHADIVRFLNE